ncbi:MAG TPA: tripartite tricarboxylate transporter substrate binding protein [Burkholderiales bacterium]|nr:tripartite tricarboxylate transporter substrate binding protein [Burkholderiales bacterium]
MKILSTSTCLLLAAGLLNATAWAQNTWKPERNVEIISGTAAGGAVDKANRVVQKIWQEKKIVEASSTVVNRPGGGNTIAWNYINQHAGDGHYVSIAPYTLLTNKIVGTSPMTWSDFSVIALLFNEYITVAVRADSPIKTAADLVARLKKDPSSLSIAVASTLGNHIHIGIAKPLKAAGVDIKKLKVVAFKSSGESVTALLGGHIDVVSSTTPNVIGQLQAGTIRVIAIGSAARISGALAGVPTWKEQGVNDAFNASQGAIGPKGLNAAQLAFWESAFEKLAQTDEWKKELAANYWDSNFRSGKDAEKYYAEQATDLREILTDLGLAKQ